MEVIFKNISILISELVNTEIKRYVNNYLYEAILLSIKIVNWKII